jgi:hypothetical protein
MNYIQHKSEPTPKLISIINCHNYYKTGVNYEKLSSQLINDIITGKKLVSQEEIKGIINEWDGISIEDIDMNDLSNVENDKGIMEKFLKETNEMTIKQNDKIDEQNKKMIKWLSKTGLITFSNKNKEQNKKMIKWLSKTGLT